MITFRQISIGVLLMLAGCDIASAQRSAGRAKPRLIAALREIQKRAGRIHESPGNASLSSVTHSIADSAGWLANMAVRWSPKEPAEGKPLLQSIERALRALRKAPAGGPQLEPLLQALSDDLSIKAEHCSQKGLATPQRVTVVTKKNGLDEVKGLAVQYIEKFFQSDPNVSPQEFRRFSSPAVDDLAPGRYVIWAKETSPAGRVGQRKEIRVGSGLPTDPIEVLTP